MICNPLSVAFVSVHCTRCAVFPTPQLCLRRVMACAFDRTPNIISTAFWNVSFHSGMAVFLTRQSSCQGLILLLKVIENSNRKSMLCQGLPNPMPEATIFSLWATRSCVFLCL